MPRFSIIIPVYNVERYLNECVNSVLQQSFPDFEAILVDDGSTDSSGAMCDQFAAQDTRIHVIHQMNRGLSAARNAGIDKSTGDYIVFLDSDDFWKDEFVLKIINNHLTETQAEVLSVNYIKYDGINQYEPYFNSTVRSANESVYSLHYHVTHNLWIACAWNKVIKRSLFDGDALRFVEGITSEDMDWSVRLALRASSFAYASDVVVCYRQRVASISQTVSANKVNTVLDNIDRCLSAIQGAEDKGDLLKPFVAYQYGTALFHTAAVNDSAQRKKLIQRLKKKRYVLKWSSNKKVKLLDCAVSLGGIHFAIFLLGLKNKL